MTATDILYLRHEKTNIMDRLKQRPDQLHSNCEADQRLCFHYTESLFVLCSGLTSNIICHIMTVSGCDRELNAHFYSAATLWYQISDTFT